MKRMNFVWGVLIAAFVLLLSACRSTKKHNADGAAR